jgi:hypothetical protein
MGQIYAGAVHAVIYLGPADIDSRESVLSCNTYGSACAPCGHEPLIIAAFIWRVVHSSMGCQELEFSTDPWIQCGRIRVPWDKFTVVLAKRTDHLPDSDSWRWESTMEPIENRRRKIIFEMQGV